MTATRGGWSITYVLPALLAACAAAVAPAPPAALPAASTAAVGPAAPGASAVALVNPGFESTKPGPRGDPEGWYSFQHAGDLSYRFVIDTTGPHSGTRSLRIDNVGPEPYGAVAQIVDAAPHIGKVARLTAWMRTNAADNGAVLTLLVLKDGATLAQNFMADAPVKGTTGWIRYTIELPVTQGANRLEVGAMMRGRGSLWLDDVALEFVAPGQAAAR